MYSDISRIFRLTVVSLAIGGWLAACGDNPEKMLSSAKEFMAKNDGKAAVIQLKNALQANPNSAEARFLLGKALWLSGDAVGAATELGKARELKYSDDEVVPLLAKALIAQGQAKKVAEEFGKVSLSSAAAKADLMTSIAQAWSILGKEDNFQTSLAAALAAQPGYAPAMVAQGRFKAAKKDFDGALAIAESVLSATPKNEEAHRLKGDILLYAKNQPTEALASYRLAVQAKPDFTSGQVSVINILLQQGNLAEAGKEVDALKKFANGLPVTRYLEAQLAYQNKNYKGARDLVLQVLKSTPSNARALQLAGAAEYQLNSMLQAEAYLAKAVLASPDLSLARRMLVMTYLRTGQVPKALATLPADLAKDDRDLEMLSVAGQAYLQSGDVNRAQSYFARAAKMDPKDPRKRTALATTQLMSGQTEVAFAELQDVALTDSGTTADMALISAYLQRKDYDKALKAIDALEKKKPTDPQAALLRGRTLVAKQDVPAARKSFENALTIDPKFFPAVANLAALDMVDKKPQDAKKRFEGLLEKDPKNVQALVALAELAARTDAGKDEVAALLGKAVSANPTEVAPNVMLIEFHLRNKDAKKALAAAQNALATLPDNPELLDVLGRTQVAAGEANQAVITYNKLATLQPQSPQAQLRLAGVHLANKNPDGAAQSLRKALEIKPDLLEAQRGLAGLAMDNKKSSDALAISRDIQKQRPKEAAGYVLEGDIQSSQKNWDAAAVAYKNGLKQVSSPELAIKLHTTLAAGGKKAEADKFASDWQKDNPKDAAMPFYLGDRATAASDFALAEKSYQQALKLQPNSPVLYNNLAWIVGRLGKEGALAYAEKANTLSPNQPAFMDTWAMLLSEKGEAARALELQKKVVALQPDAAMFKLNLAKIQIKAGDKTAAKATLDEIARLGSKYGGQAEVEKLLKQL